MEEVFLLGRGFNLLLHPHHSTNKTQSLHHLCAAHSLHIHIMAIQDEKKKVDIETEHTESIEPELGAVSKIDADVLSIEEVAASKAAWLISVTVSLGGYTSTKTCNSRTMD